MTPDLSKFGVMYYHTFSKLADHRWIKEKGYITMHHILLFTRATPGTPSSYICFSTSPVPSFNTVIRAAGGIPCHQWNIYIDGLCSQC